MVDNRIWYVYGHIRADKKEPFYIGIGKKHNFKRSEEKKGRNEIWHKITSKTKWLSNVIYDNLSHKEACEIEKTLISHFGRLNLNTGTLCNLTDGGEGNSGCVFSEERRRRISEGLKGKKLAPERIEKMRQRRQTEATKNKLRLLKTGLKASEETKRKMSQSSMGMCNPAVINRRKKVIDIETGAVYESLKEAAKSINISRSHLGNMLRGRFENHTKMRYV